MSIQLPETIQRILRNGVEDSLFSGAAAAIFCNKDGRSVQYTGYAGYTDRQQHYVISSHTFFDLASLTKPLVTVLALVVLVQEQAIQLEEKIDRFFPGQLSPELAAISIRDLLRHSSGLPPHRNYFVQLLQYPASQRKRKLLDQLVREQLVSATGNEHQYSDLGFMLLGEIVERVTGNSLDEFWSSRIARRCAINTMLCFPQPGEFSRHNCAATRTCPWTHRVLCGSVDDENARSIGGVAGHAGLFGTVGGVLQLCRIICDAYTGKHWNEVFSQTVLHQFCTKAEQSSWAFGFDTPSPTASSSGSHFSDHSIGHLGFTGTSFWIDLKREIGVVLLTNRVHMSAGNEKIRQFRPFFHDAVMKEIMSE